MKAANRIPRTAVFCRKNCQIALETLEFFQREGCEISLVVIETSERKSLSRTERDFQKAHAAFHRRLSPWFKPATLQKTVLALLPPFAQGILRKLFTSMASGHVKGACRRTKTPFAEVKRHSSEETVRLLKEAGISYVLITSSSWLIKEPLLSLESVKIINAHCAKLPQHRSLDSLPWSLLANDPIGLSLHLVDKGIDTGPILQFIEIPPQPGDNLITLRKRIDQKKPEAFLTSIQGLQNASIQPMPQREEEGTRHRPMTLKELIDAKEALQNRLTMN